MKSVLVFSTGVALALALAACGQKTEAPAISAADSSGSAMVPSGSMAAMPTETASARSGAGSGTVTAVDAGSVTIDHGPIPDVGWPAMTMRFNADPGVAQAAKVGDRVQFDVTVDGPDAQVTAIRPQ